MRLAGFIRPRENTELSLKVLIAWCLFNQILKDWKLQVPQCMSSLKHLKFRLAEKGWEKSKAQT